MRSCLGVYVKDIDREALRLIGVRSFIEDFSRRQLVRPNSSMLLFAFIFALFFSVLQLCNARFLDLTFTLRCSLAQYTTLLTSTHMQDLHYIRSRELVSVSENVEFFWKLTKPSCKPKAKTSSMIPRISPLVL
ncbi:hypothetical protein HBI00_146020 [Parastagonospora nodorum]|nr:hypothetical protein HBI00_146020 [Parastagonospora nodorum]